METIHQHTRNYKRIRIGESTQENPLEYSGSNTPVLSGGKPASSKKEEAPTLKNIVETEKPEPGKSQPLLLPPPPVRYLKPGKFDYF